MRGSYECEYFGTIYYVRFPDGSSVESTHKEDIDEICKERGIEEIETSNQI